jgi:creatinine amidohydrolase
MTAMTPKVDYEELFPHEFQERLARRAVAYLPLGTLEWHGPQNALGADALQARGLFRMAARRFGGIVLPPLWLGPDRITRQAGGPDLVGMDTADVTLPHRQLPGSCYWAPKGLFISLCENVVAQAARAGFRCIVADGHGPSRAAWAEMADAWERRYAIKLVSAARDFPGAWKTQMDHAGRNETSVLMAVEPDRVDLSRLPADRGEWPLGVHGEDPRDSTAAYGNELLEATLALIGARLDALGIQANG